MLVLLAPGFSSSVVGVMAGQAIMQIGNPAHTLGPWTGLALFAGYTAVTIAAAAFLLKRRDV